MGWPTITEMGGPVNQSVLTHISQMGDPTSVNWSLHFYTELRSKSLVSQQGRGPGETGDVSFHL